MTVEEFFAQPIEQIILDPDFVQVILSKELCSPYMWEITMACTYCEEKRMFMYRGRPMPFARAKFHKLFSPLTHNPNIYQQK